MMSMTMFDGNQTSFNIMQHRATSCNMVAKRVQHVGFNNVGRCCINMLDPFGRALTLNCDIPRGKINSMFSFSSLISNVEILHAIFN